MQLKQAFTSSIFLKATSLIIGFLFWTIIGDSFHSHVWLKIPITFYNVSEKKIEAPETIYLQLKGKRSHLRHLQARDLAVHIDAQQLRSGPNQIEVTADLLFLPPTILVGEAIPLNVVIKVQGDPQ